MASSSLTIYLSHRTPRKSLLHDVGAPKVRMLEKLRSYGLAGLLSYGLLNTAYYSFTFLLVWFYVVPAPGKLGYLASVKRFFKLLAMVWAGSQVTKLIRAAGALALAPFVKKGLSGFTLKFKFQSEGKVSDIALLSKYIAVCMHLYHQVTQINVPRVTRQLVNNYLVYTPNAENPHLSLKHWKFYVVPAPGKLGYLASVKRFFKLLAMVWAGSQVTKLIRAAGALALAPFVKKGLSGFTLKFKFQSEGKVSDIALLSKYIAVCMHLYHQVTQINVPRVTRQLVNNYLVYTPNAENPHLSLKHWK
uniref:Uncharacterized protein n=1 Tax=Daucus carota subsp. sativus TaxID=79200 RepID=A0A166GRQ1_DAUCS